MTVQKHSSTPGPWKCSMLGGGKGSGNDWSVRVDVPRSSEAQYAVAVVRRKSVPGEAAANAHLIAAAPEMLERLKTIFSGRACACRFNRYLGKEPPCDTCQIGALVKKAGGV